MTDNDIVKALECCVNGEDCLNCPLQEQFADCKPMTGALDLINRQKAEIRSNDEGVQYLREKIAALSLYIDKKEQEIEDLRHEIRNLECEKGQLEGTTEYLVEQAKVEGYKEFAERLKPRLGFGTYTSYEELDNLVKEMVGKN